MVYQLILNWTNLLSTEKQNRQRHMCHKFFFNISLSIKKIRLNKDPLFFQLNHLIEMKFSKFIQLVLRWPNTFKWSLANSANPQSISEDLSSIQSFCRLFCYFEKQKKQIKRQKNHSNKNLKYLAGCDECVNIVERADSLNVDDTLSVDLDYYSKKSAYFVKLYRRIATVLSGIKAE